MYWQPGTQGPSGTAWCCKDMVFLSIPTWRALALSPGLHLRRNLSAKAVLEQGGLQRWLSSNLKLALDFPIWEKHGYVGIRRPRPPLSLWIKFPWTVFANWGASAGEIKEPRWEYSPIPFQSAQCPETTCMLTSCRDHIMHWWLLQCFPVASLPAGLWTTCPGTCW